MNESGWNTERPSYLSAYRGKDVEKSADRNLNPEFVMYVRDTGPGDIEIYRAITSSVELR